MTHVRDYYNISLSNLTLYELISAFCTDIITEPPGYKHLWYKVHYRQQLKSKFKKRWSSDLVDINVFLKTLKKNVQNIYLIRMQRNRRDLTLKNIFRSLLK